MKHWGSIMAGDYFELKARGTNGRTEIVAGGDDVYDDVVYHFRSAGNTC